MSTNGTDPGNTQRGMGTLMFLLLVYFGLYHACTLSCR